jgi:uncharacterized protein
MAGRRDATEHPPEAPAAGMDAWIGQLSDPCAFPHDPSARAGVDRVDTHISHVFLTGERVYKLRRPVRLSFLDFTTSAERVADCLREVTLNRRLAPDVYLGVAPLRLHGGRIEVGTVVEEPSSEPDVVEHCVVMRRLARGRDLQSLVASGRANAAHVDRVATRLARFHAEHGLGRPAPFDVTNWLARTTAPVRANFDTLADAPPALAPHDEVAEAKRRAAALVESRRADFDRRREDGRVVDGHGDLHAEHVWFEHDDSDPLMVDCLEFRDDFRQIDVASDIAFLAMDLAYRGRRDLSSRLLRRYARESGDYHLFAVVDYFLSYRALVRAKVSSLVAGDASLPDEQRRHAALSVRRHLDLGHEYLRAPGKGAVFVLCGTIGTGKTTVAEALADRTGGVVISSDWLRKTATAEAIRRYSDAGRSAVYEQMLREARHVVLSGRTAILDATYSRREWRNASAAWANEHAGKVALIEIVAPKDDVIARLAARSAAGNDASEAGPGLYDTIRSEYEEPVEWPHARRAQIDTSRSDWPERLTDAAARLG